MTEPSVTITDYVIAAECLYLTNQIHSAPGYAAFFLSTAVAATAGGTVHGFFTEEESAGYKILWLVTLLSLGVTAWSGFYIAAELALPASTQHLAHAVAGANFLIYAIVVSTLRQDFRIAIFNYVPSLLCLGAAFLIASPQRLAGAAGVALMLAAATLQQLRVGLSRQLDHNALYHVLQAIALYLIFLASRMPLHTGVLT